MRPLRRLAACRDNGASGEGVSALSAGAIAWLKSLRPKLGVGRDLLSSLYSCPFCSNSSYINTILLRRRAYGQAGDRAG